MADSGCQLRSVLYEAVNTSSFCFLQMVSELPFKSPGCPGTAVILCIGGRGWSSPLQTKKSPFCFLWTAFHRVKLYPRWPSDVVDPGHSKWSLCGGSTVIIWEKWKCWVSGPPTHPGLWDQNLHFHKSAVGSLELEKGCFMPHPSPPQSTRLYSGRGGELMGWVLQYHMPMKSLLPCKLFLGLLIEPFCQSFSSFCFFFFRFHSVSVIGLACLWNPIPHGLTPSVHQSKVSFIHRWTSYRPTRYLQIWFNASGHAMIEKIPTLPHSKIAGSLFSHDHIRAHANSRSNCTIHSL